MKKLHVWPHRVVIRLVTIRDRGPIVCHCGFELRNTAGCNSSRFQQTLWHTKQSTLFKTTIFGGTPSSGIKWVQVEGLEIRPYRMIRTGKKYRDRRKIIKTILYKIIYIYIYMFVYRKYAGGYILCMFRYRKYAGGYILYMLICRKYASGGCWMVLGDTAVSNVRICCTWIHCLSHSTGPS